jgi:hypothetical protein
VKIRSFLAGIVIAGFLSGMPALVHADEYHHGSGAYDEQHQWHPSDWWMEHNPNWVRTHHAEWAKNGDWDEHHHWHDRDWWKQHNPQWAKEHHHDWF